MAQQKTGKKSSGNKKTAAKKKTAAVKRKTKNDEKKTARRIWTVLLFALGALFCAITFVPGENLWVVFKNALFAVFGLCAWAVGPIMIVVSVLLGLDKPAAKHRIWQAAVLICLVCGAIQVFAYGMPSGDNFWQIILNLAKSSIAGNGGGLLSAVFGVSLLAAVGGTAAKVVIVLLTFVFIMIVTGMALLDPIRAAKKPVKKIEEAVAQRKEQKKERFDIDVPMAGDPEPETEKAPPAAIQKDDGDMQKAKNRLLGLMNDTKAEPGKNLYQPDRTKTKAAENEINEQDLEELVNKALALEHNVWKPELTVTEEVPEPAAEDNRKKAVKQEKQETRKKQAIQESQEKQEALYTYPPIKLLNEPQRKAGAADTSEELRQNAQRLVDTLKSFGVSVKVTDISCGPAVTRYELQPAAGVKISRITNLADDIALNLAATGVRIEAPIPNKAAVGIEVPNKQIGTVTIREILESREFAEAKSRLTVALGRDISGNVIVTDIAAMPHLLIAGSTGSGKSVCINSLIISLLFKASPDEVKLLMIDPKVVELGVYNGLPHLLVPVVTEPKKAAGALGWAVTEMLKRYKLFASVGARDITAYNKTVSKREDMEKLPQIVIIIDELSDLMMAAPSEVEDYICRLAQMARAAGMHLIIATQRPSVDVITGIIKANIPSRIAFAVSSQIDSRTILDMGGAEKLLGRGDMLFNPVGATKPLRIQGCFVTDREIERVAGFIKDGQYDIYNSEIQEEIERQAMTVKGSKKDTSASAQSSDAGDDMLDAAIECVIEAGQASTSLLQRRLKLGYARAARIVDEMEERGIVGPFEGSKPRAVLISRERWMEMKLSSSGNKNEQ